jgi:proteasome assembly chaperone (PAC2) family protein
VQLDHALQREIVWPENTFSTCTVPGAAEASVITLLGVEPQLRWRTFSDLVVEVARSLGVELVLTLGALLAEVPHTRPVRVTGTAQDPALSVRLGLQPSRYEGPTGIVGILHEAFGRAGIPSASLWASVPAYVGQTPSPKAALALVTRVGELLGVNVPTVDLDVAAAAYERQVDEVVSADEDATAYVRSLEDALDDGDDEDDDDVDDEGDVLDPADLPGGDVLAAEVERYLREQQ